MKRREVSIFHFTSSSALPTLFGQAEGEVIPRRMQGKMFLRPSLVAILLSSNIVEEPSRKIYSKFL
jgi:hypothetical protein